MEFKHWYISGSTSISKLPFMHTFSQYQLLQPVPKSELHWKHATPKTYMSFINCWNIVRRKLSPFTKCSLSLFQYYFKSSISYFGEWNLANIFDFLSHVQQLLQNFPSGCSVQDKKSTLSSLFFPIFFVRSLVDSISA